MENLTVKQIVEKVSNNDISPTEVVGFYLSNIKKQDKDLHSFLSLNENAIEQAEEFVIGKHQLPGVPFAVKDNRLVEGMRATAASKMLKDYEAPYTATAVSQLVGEGAFVLGKTNMDEFAMGSSTENSAFGATYNPHDISRVPGGSSGGSAAAVAAGLAPFALGSDTGGSIRQPAAFCGVVGLKPSYGAVSRYGLISMASSLDQIGPITKTVEDARIVFANMIGVDDMDATSLELDKHVHVKNAKELTLGVVTNFMEGADQNIAKKVQEVVDAYMKMGAKVKEIELPHAEYGLAAYYIIMPSEVSSNLARYDGIRYPAKSLARLAKAPAKRTSDHKANGMDLLNEYLEVRGNGFGRETRKRVMLGTYTLSAGYYDAYYLKAQRIRTLITRDFEKAFEAVDVIVSPTTPSLPFKMGERTRDTLAMYKSDLVTVGVNLAGLPAISIPAGTVREDGKDLPVGMQFIGKQQDDFTLLEIASWYERMS